MRKRNKMVSFRMTEQEYNAWKKYCREKRISQTDALCQFIERI